MTLRQWSAEDARAPMATNRMLEELGRAMELQELFTRQSPPMLKDSARARVDRERTVLQLDRRG
jgi:hypothetical protein